MNLDNKYKLIGLVPLCLMVSCASNPQKTRTAAVDTESSVEDVDGRKVTNAAANDAKAHNFVEIEFYEGSAELTSRAKESLSTVVEQARQAGKIDEVLVLSWSDNEYPAKNINRLSKPQIDLAEKRNNVVEAYVKSLRNVSVESYNMAERPNVLSKWFNTDDSKLKNSFIAAGLPTTADSPQYPSKASHSVVLIKIE